MSCLYRGSSLTCWKIHWIVRIRDGVSSCKSVLTNTVRSNQTAQKRLWTFVACKTNLLRQQRPRDFVPPSLSHYTSVSFKGSIVLGAVLATFSHLHNTMQGVTFYELFVFYSQPSRQPFFTFLNSLPHLHHQLILHQRYGVNIFNWFTFNSGLSQACTETRKWLSKITKNINKTVPNRQGQKIPLIFP